MLQALEILVSAVFIVLFLTQIVAPLWMGRQPFPLFRQRDPYRELQSAREYSETARILKEAAETRKRTAADTAPSPSDASNPGPPETPPSSNQETH